MAIAAGSGESHRGNRQAESGEGGELDYFLESVKIMLIVAALSAFISMLVAWIIRLLFAAIRRQSTYAAAKLEAAALASAKPASDEPGKVA